MRRRSAVCLLILLAAATAAAKITGKVSLSPTSLTFTSQTVGTTSPSQAVTLTNTGKSTVTITSITITGTNSGDFAQTNACAASLAPKASCTINVTFTPTATGTRTAAVSISDSASGSPQTAALTGTGATGTGTPVASVSPTSVTFGNQTVGTTSTAQGVTLTNSGNATLSVSGITITGTNSGDFAQTNTCGASLVPGASCTINVTFTPAATGTRTAAVSITDNATGSPQAVSLTGTGIAPAVTLSPTSLLFGNQLVGTTSSAQSVNLTNSGTATLNITSIAITGTNGGDFGQTNTCGASLPPGASCTINVTFTPAAAGTRTGAISITHNASGSPQTVVLTGTGTTAANAPSPFFGMTISAGATYPAVTVGALAKPLGGSWGRMESTSGNINFTILDEATSLAASNGIDLIYTIHGVPSWAANPSYTCTLVAGCPGPPQNQSDLTNFVTAVASRYAGKIKYYELWNEPNNSAEWASTAAALVTQSQAVYNAIKAADPNALVITPGVAAADSAYMTTYLQAGGSSWADVGSYHAYPRSAANLSFCAGAPLDCTGSFMLGYESDMQTTFDNNGMSGKPVFVTEGGWGSDKSLTDSSTQVAYVARWLLLLNSGGVTRSYWYAWSNAGWGTLVGTAAATAWQQVYNWLNGRTLSVPCAVQADNVTWECGIRGSGTYTALVVWAYSGTVNFTPGSRYTDYLDLAGNSYALTNGETVTVGVQPLLFEAPN